MCFFKCNLYRYIKCATSVPVQQSMLHLKHKGDVARIVWWGLYRLNPADPPIA
jgi:hypothetical protein